MPLFEQMFDDYFRFRLTSDQKRRITAEAARRRMSGADLMREFADGLPRTTEAADAVTRKGKPLTTRA